MNSGVNTMESFDRFLKNLGLEIPDVMIIYKDYYIAFGRQQDQGTSLFNKIIEYFIENPEATPKFEIGLMRYGFLKKKTRGKLLIKLLDDTTIHIVTSKKISIEELIKTLPEDKRCYLALMGVII